MYKYGGAKYEKEKEPEFYVIQNILIMSLFLPIR